MELNLPGMRRKKETEKSLVVTKDLLPDRLMVIPLHDRPMFPKMMGPIIVDDMFCNRLS